MKFSKIFSLLLVAGMIMTGCSDNDDGAETPISSNAQFTTADQMGRPAVNTVFLSSSSKNSFNTTAPSAQNAAFAAEMETNLAALSPAYAEETDENALGQNRNAFIGLLATDVLNVSLTSPTTFYDGTNLLTGRNLTDDVITVELILIFGGETGLSNPEFPGLSDDNVDANDKAFLSTFPYLAAPF
tara:strand:- start:1722 stop:2279 length:558 start_codon:yes stop_codon:yes gene_type:complete